MYDHRNLVSEYCIKNCYLPTTIFSLQQAGQLCGWVRDSLQFETSRAQSITDYKSVSYFTPRFIIANHPRLTLYIHSILIFSEFGKEKQGDTGFHLGNTILIITFMKGEEL